MANIVSVSFLNGAKRKGANDLPSLSGAVMEQLTSGATAVATAEANPFADGICMIYSDTAIRVRAGATPVAVAEDMIIPAAASTFPHPIFFKIDKGHKVSVINV